MAVYSKIHLLLILCHVRGVVQISIIEFNYAVTLCGNLHTNRRILMDDQVFISTDWAIQRNK